jgi:uncharacterized membrane protein YkvA (DUF1232 family)
MWWHTAVRVLAGLILTDVTLVLMLLRYAREHPNTITGRDALRLLPDPLRLIRRLAADPAVPTGARDPARTVLAYLASPIDLIPDFLPVIGYADDAIIIALVLRSVTRTAGSHALHRHWPGTPDGLRLIQQLTGLPTADTG